MRFDTKNFTQFLFATGDGAQWLVASKEAVVGEYYSSDAARDITQSVTEPWNHTEGHWLFREGHSVDPLVSLNGGSEDTYTSGAVKHLLYAEASYGKNTQMLTTHNGLNVYVRNNPDPDDLRGVARVRGSLNIGDR